MIKKKVTYSFLFLIIIGVAMVFNHRYPFFTPETKGWSIGYMKTNNPVKKMYPSTQNIIIKDSLRAITNGQTRFIADPFLFVDNNIFYLFFEHQEILGPAKIGLFISHDGLEYNFKGNVIDESFHLSFPQVIDYKGKEYILPESASINNVVLYESVDFPLQWEISDTLIADIKLKDPAILISDSLNLITGIDENYIQRIFRSDSLFGNWEEDYSFKIRQGDEIRPAGNFFTHSGKWYLPFQNNTEGYGTGVALYALNDDRFEKIISKQLYKSDSIKWFNRGMHHLNVNFLNGEYYLVYDGDEVLEDKFNFTLISSIKYNLSDLYNYVNERIF